MNNINTNNPAPKANTTSDPLANLQEDTVKMRKFDNSAFRHVADECERTKKLVLEAQRSASAQSRGKLAKAFQTLANSMGYSILPEGEYKNQPAAIRELCK